MKDLNDNDFDKVFKSRITEEFPEFEEESWLKMEEKLRKKDRLIFLRYASIMLLFLSFGIGFYFFTQQNPLVHKDGFLVKEKMKQRVKKGNPNDQNNQITSNPELANTTEKIVQQSNISPIKSVPQPTKFKNLIEQPQNLLANQKSEEINQSFQTVEKPTQIAGITNVGNVQNQETNQAISVAQTENIKAETLLPLTNTPDQLITDTVAKKKVIAKLKRKIPISLAISAGPDFNSTSALIGGKTSAAFGIGIGIGLSKKLSLQTGVDFGFKNYNANSYDYTFNNPNTQATIETVKAACKVLEIPIRASYLLSQNQRRNISFNAGLSSYFMLKENYIYVYTAASGRKDRINDFTNQNKHLLSVVDLSATYNIKLKNKKLGFGIEPYVKIPLTGIGEGRVPLKSSGISLKLNYEFNKN